MTKLRTRHYGTTFIDRKSCPRANFYYKGRGCHVPRQNSSLNNSKFKHSKLYSLNNYRIRHNSYLPPKPIIRTIIISTHLRYNYHSYLPSRLTISSNYHHMYRPSRFIISRNTYHIDLPTSAYNSTKRRCRYSAISSERSTSRHVCQKLTPRESERMYST